jgi:hypothetical protein
MRLHGGELERGGSGGQRERDILRGGRNVRYLRLYARTTFAESKILEFGSKRRTIRVQFRSFKRGIRGELLRFSNPFRDGIEISNLKFLSDSVGQVCAISSIFE